MYEASVNVSTATCQSRKIYEGDMAYFDICQETRELCRYRHSRYPSLIAEFDPLTSRIRTASYYTVIFITAGYRILVGVTNVSSPLCSEWL
jgi:hypothetical protein